MDEGSAEIVEMTAGESEWALWANSQDVETYGLCACGHEGLGPAWHLAGCRGAYEALWRKAYELFRAISIQWRWAHAVQCQALLVEEECELGDGCLWPRPY